MVCNGMCTSSLFLYSAFTEDTALSEVRFALYIFSNTSGNTSLHNIASTSSAVPPATLIPFTSSTSSPICKLPCCSARLFSVRKPNINNPLSNICGSLLMSNWSLLSVLGTSISSTNPPGESLLPSAVLTTGDESSSGLDKRD